MSDLAMRFVGWCILGPKGLFLHGLGEEYFGGAKWVSIGDEPTFYVEREGAEDMIAQLVLLDASLMDRLQVQEAYRLADGQYVIKALVDLIVDGDGKLRTELLYLGKLDKVI